MQIKQAKPANLLAMVAAKEIDQPMGGGDVGADRMRGAAAAMGKMTRPARRKGTGRMLFVL